MSIVATRLRMARERKNLKQTQVKHRTGINNKTLSGYELNVSEPDIETLRILANLYDVSVDWLIGDTDDPKPKEGAREKSQWPYEGILKDIKEKYPNVDLNDPDIKRKFMKVIDLVLDDHEK